MLTIHSPNIGRSSLRHVSPLKLKRPSWLSHVRLQMDDENKQLQRLLDDATLKRESAQDRLRGLEVPTACLEGPMQGQKGCPNSRTYPRTSASTPRATC